MFGTVETSRSPASDVFRVVYCDRLMTAHITSEQSSAIHLDSYPGENAHVPFLCVGTLRSVCMCALVDSSDV